MHWRDALWVPALLALPMVARPMPRTDGGLGTSQARGPVASLGTLAFRPARALIGGSGANVVARAGGDRPSSTFRLTPGVYPLRLERVAGSARLPAEPVALPLSAHPLRRPVAQPPYVSERPLYSALLLGDPGTPVMFALDEAGGTGTGYNRLYADLALDGNLAVPPLAGRSRRAGEFLTVDFICPGMPAVYGEGEAAQRRPVRLRIHGYRLGQAGTRAAGGWRFEYALAEYRSGEIASDRGPVRVVLIDSAMRAAYNRRCVYGSALPDGQGAGPQLWLGPDPANPGFPASPLIREPGSSREPLHLTLGAAQLIGDDLYRFEPSPWGDSLAVLPYEGPAGCARIAATNARREPLPVAQLTLLGSGGRYEFGAPDGAVEQVIPDGEYFVLATVRQPDRAGEWVFRFRSRVGIELPPDCTTPVGLGGRLRAEIAPAATRLAARRGDRLPLPLYFVSDTGLELVGLERPADAPGRRSTSARVTLRSPRGRVVARGGSGFA